MADDRMKNDDRDMNLGGAGQQQGDYGKQTPGRNPMDDKSTGQRGGGQQGAGQNPPGHHEDDFAKTGKTGGQGGQGSKDQGNKNF
jgi:hypothetical protein